MKNNVLKYYIAAFYFCSIFAMFAQTPGTENGQTGDGSLEDAGLTDTTPLPIDDYIWILALLGLIFVCMKFRAIKKANS